MSFITGIIQESVKLFWEMSPYLLLGFIFAGILHVFISIETIGKHLGKGKFMSVIKSVIFGIPLPLCSCGVIPASVLLRRSGANRGSVISFLIATPITGADSILATYSLFGFFFAAYRVIASSLTAIFAGIVGNLVKYGETDGHLTDKEANGAECPHCVGDADKDNGRKKKGFKEFAHYAFIKSISDIYKWLLLGTLIGGVITYIIPESFIENYVGSSFLSMIIMLVAGIPMYVCSTGSIPIAASLMLKGISPGAALVFLLAGPATNAVTITVVSRELGKKATFIYVFVIAAMSLIMGALLDLLPGIIGVENISHLAHSGILPKWLHQASTWILFALIIVALARNLRDSFGGKKKN